jgi:uncharacterized protein (TIGR02596 family)
MKANPFFLSHRRGFSLVELLTVLAIMAVLVTLTGPSVIQALQGTSLTRAAAMVQNNLKAAHQYALSLQNTVAVRFYQIPKATGNFSALQLFEVTPQVSSTGVVSTTYNTYVPLTPVINLPAPNIMVTTTTPYTYSSLLNSPAILPTSDPANETDVQTPISIPVYGENYLYVDFRFLPSGGQQTNLPLTPPAGVNGYYVTIAASTQTTLKNFYTIQVDPVTAKVTFYRP